ncbi:hypothetical protein Acsp03_63550 [Actinomadura sp. NBRC 104412]|uniref:C2 family cysteine protease n=1 Tax=Actinomadura sp. NBRC 104412 TaxID=3032203 RepID=UPI0024A1C1C9|nr:C2 family cysteine protease [Actinomadura sp. NBRC 104412]GLZ08889.1 hypothetical protein Acsp03_63550 [Actinomadura sp. NBRC 104412]
MNARTAVVIAGVLGALALSGCGVRASVSTAPVSEVEWGRRAADPTQVPPPPSGEEKAVGVVAAGEVRDALEGDCAWYEILCDRRRSVREIVGRLSPGEINALFGEFGRDEVRRLLRRDGVVDVLKARADVSLLHHLERLAPRSIEPDFTDVPSYTKKPSSPATAWGAVRGGRLFGTEGEPSLQHVRQGGIADCWWLAGMGALANSHEGRTVLKEMVRPNPNGTYTVAFPDGKKVTVTPYFPIDEEGRLAFASPEGRAPAIWPLVLEKALAERWGGYGRLVQGDGGDAMELLTGRTGRSKPPHMVGEEELAAAVRQGAVTVLTPDDGRGAAIFEGRRTARLRTDHVYVVERIDGQGRLRLYNPWGRDHATVTFEEFRRHFEDVDMSPVR